MFACGHDTELFAWRKAAIIAIFLSKLGTIVEDQSRYRKIRSYVLREGRLTRGQARAMEVLWPVYGLTIEQGELACAEVFGRDAPCVLEIGFGMGDSLVAMAARELDKNFIGIEVHRPGVGTALQGIREQDLNNLRLYNQDAVEVLRGSIRDNSLARVQIFFPDPWHKKRHHKRRLLSADFAELILSKLQVGGELHLATDWENYAEQMLEVLGGNTGFRNIYGDGGYMPEGERLRRRPITKFEQRGQRLGHVIRDLLFVKLG